jgi:BirA family transcriptional regulator, biotin operon repressor / biotin---[acetyl-CoA-carboxylase] ligase
VAHPSHVFVNEASQAAAVRVSQTGCWTLHEYEWASSTNLLAAPFPAWHAIRADRQQAGRGRFQRTWVSDPGGLWLSAVLPAPPAPVLPLLPLTVGLAVCDSLQALDVPQLRMRWPNDVLVGPRKLAGLLIDQFRPDLAVVGIGINVTNHPEACDSSLSGQVIRLQDLVPECPPLAALTRRVLSSLEHAFSTLVKQGPEALLPRINSLWAGPRRVQLDLDGLLVWGDFEGVDGQGRLRLRMAGEETRLYEPRQVRLLREIPPSV